MKAIITEWRETGELDWANEPLQEVFVVGVGWCRYSWKLACIVVNGRWIEDWDYAPAS